MMCLMSKSLKYAIKMVILKKINMKLFILCSLIFTVYLFTFYILSDNWYKKNVPIPLILQKVNLPYVVVHFDLKGSPPKIGYLKSLLPTLKEHGVNALLMEYEDMFPYEGTLKNLSSKHCYNKTELQTFINVATNKGMEIIPLIQTFGHMEFALKLPEFQDLRESPMFPESLCPSKHRSVHLIRRMLNQIIVFHNRISPLKHIHIGCDEVYHINKCSECRSKNYTDVQLFLRHLDNVHETAKSIDSNITVLFWDDMLRNRIVPWKFRRSKIDLEPVYWSYSPNFELSHVHVFNYYKTFGNIWIASAYKGADGRAATFPNLENRYWNHYNWIEKILNYKIAGENNVYSFKGLILTGWSRYSHMAPVCELLPVSIPSLYLNLLLVALYKRGFGTIDQINNAQTIFDKYLAEKFSDRLRCKNVSVSNFNPLACSFDGIELYYALINYSKNKKELISQFNSENQAVYSIEYYSKHGIINMNDNRHIKWVNSTRKNLHRIENKIRSTMSCYYNDDSVEEYVSYKMYNEKELLRRLFEIFNNSSDARTWERRP